MLALIFASFFTAPSPPDAAARAIATPAASALVATIELSALLIGPDVATIATDDDGSKVFAGAHGDHRLYPVISRTSGSPAAFGILRQMSEIRAGLTRAPPAG